MDHGIRIPGPCDINASSLRRRDRERHLPGCVFRAQGYPDPLKTVLASAADFSPSDLLFVYSIFLVSREGMKEAE